jgi:hypothetical protein
MIFSSFVSHQFNIVIKPLLNVYHLCKPGVGISKIISKAKKISDF